MRKLILILSLFTLGVKAQIVGGFVPLNSTKTPTMGGAKINGNLNVTGTGSIGSTFTVNGALKASSTMSLGSANLTGGNTGTVAVLSDALFTTTHFHGLSTIGTGIIFYDKYPSSSGAGATSGLVGLTTIPFNCTLVGFEMSISVLGTLGSAGNGTVVARINNTTDVTLTSVAQYSSATTQRYSASNLNTSITAGDYVEIKVIPNCTPTAATNVTEQVMLFYSRR
jgi:hypothetical protein